jgi:hypothetical protein
MGIFSAVAILSDGKGNSTNVYKFVQLKVSLRTSIQIVRLRLEVVSMWTEKCQQSSTHVIIKSASLVPFLLGYETCRALLESSLLVAESAIQTLYWCNVDAQIQAQDSVFCKQVQILPLQTPGLM